jgi:hypothetical protein
MGPICCSETSLKGYHSMLHDIPEEHRPHLHLCVPSSNLSGNKSNFFLHFHPKFPPVFHMGGFIYVYIYVCVCIYIYHSSLPVADLAHFSPFHVNTIYQIMPVSPGTEIFN